MFEKETQVAIHQLQENLAAPRFSIPLEVDESDYPTTHLLREDEGWEPPHKDIVAAYTYQFKTQFQEYGSDNKLGELLGLSNGRRIREFKSGSRKVPYGVWRKFLIITGRAPQVAIPVMAYM